MSQKTAASRQKQTIANASMRKSVGTNTKEEMDAKTFSKKCKDFQARRNKMRANYSDLPTDSVSEPPLFGGFGSPFWRLRYNSKNY